MYISNEDLMNFLVSSGKINLDGVMNDMRQEEKKRILGKHKYEVYQGSDGRWRTYIPDESKKNGRKLIVKSAKEKLEDAIIEHYTLQEDKEYCQNLKTLRDVFPEWINYKALKTDSPSYIKRIVADWNKYYKNDPIVDKQLDGFKPIEIETWFLNKIRENELTKKAFYNMSTIIRNVFDYCEDNEVIEKNPMHKVKKIDKDMFRSVKRPSNDTEVYFHDEEEILKRAALDRYESQKRRYLTPLAIALDFNLGVRIGELVALKWSDIEDNYITIQRSEVEDYEIINGTQVRRKGVKVVDHPKTKAGYRSLYLTEESQSILRMAKKTSMEHGYYDDDFIFISKYGTRITEDGMARYLNGLCEYAELDHKSSHKIRKTFISGLFDLEVEGQKLNIDMIKNMAGHEDARTTYNNYCFETKRNKTVETIMESGKKRVI